MACWSDLRCPPARDSMTSAFPACRWRRTRRPRGGQRPDWTSSEGLGAYWPPVSVARGRAGDLNLLWSLLQRYCWMFLIWILCFALLLAIHFDYLCWSHNPLKTTFERHYS